MTELRTVHQDWERRYFDAMKQLGIAQDIQDPQRNAPRFKLLEPTKILLVSVMDKMGMLNDISVSGISFYLESGLRTGDPVVISIDQKFSGQVTIVESYQVRDGNALRKGMFRIGARFLDQEDGFRCMVNTLRLMGNIV